MYSIAACITPGNYPVLIIELVSITAVVLVHIIPAEMRGTQYKLQKDSLNTVSVLLYIYPVLS